MENRKGKEPAVELNYRPKRYREVRLKMKSGEVIVGRVQHVEKGNKDWFFMNDGKDKYIPIVMNNVDEWVYNEDV